MSSRRDRLGKGSLGLQSALQTPQSVHHDDVHSELKKRSCAGPGICSVVRTAMPQSPRFLPIQTLGEANAGSSSWLPAVHMGDLD